MTVPPLLTADQQARFAKFRDYVRARPNDINPLTADALIVVNDLNDALTKASETLAWLTERYETLRTAASALANEASALHMREDAIIALLGITNWRCLERRVAEVRAALLSYPTLTEEGQA